jgi:hypothetical protein
MKLKGSQKTALAFAALLVLISAWQLDETTSALKYWWNIEHATPTEYVVPHWATCYTWASALFAPLWLALGCGTLFLLRLRPISALVALSTYLIVAPISCASAPSLYEGAGGFGGLEELPFADAERNADLNHLIRLDERIKVHGGSVGQFPTSPDALRDAVDDLAYEISPYEQAGRENRFDLKFEMDQGTPYTTNPARPGVVCYSVNPSGTQFVLTVSGLNAPISSRPAMMRAGAFVGEKQPWGGLLATQEVLYRR